MVDSNRIITDLATFNDPVSCFENIYSTTPQLITLKKWFKACIAPMGENSLYHRQQVEEYRRCGSMVLKKSLPAICPGAVLKTRAKNAPENEKILRLTGWMQFDIDLKENNHISDAGNLRDEVKKIVYVAFCGLSVSGKGVWGIIKVKNPEKYRQHFEQLKIDFASRGITLDPTKGGNPTDLRIYSYDPDAYVAEQFQLYDRIVSPICKQIYPLKKGTYSGSLWEQASQLANMICEKGIDLAPDYQKYRDIGFALADEFGEKGRSLFHLICSTSPKYQEKDTDRQYSACINSKGTGISIGTFFHYCKEAGITVKAIKY